MDTRTFSKLIIWELEEYWSFPVLELVVATAIFSILNWSSSFITPDFRYLIVGFMAFGPNMFYIVFFLSITTGAIYSHIFAGSISRGETKMLLSYPVKKWWLLLSKFVTNLFLFFIIYVATTLVNIPLLALNPFEPMLYITFVSIFLQLIFLCSAVMIISLLLKNEIASILVSIILFLGIEVVGANNNNILSFYVRHKTIFNFFEQIFHNANAEITFQEALTALVLPVVVSALFLLISFLYFDHKMELD